MKNEHWLNLLRSELNFFNKRNSKNLTNFYYIDSTGELNHKLTEWVKHSWTIEQFFCLLNRNKLPLFLEIGCKVSSHTTIDKNGIPCKPEKINNYYYEPHSINQVRREIEVYYSETLSLLEDAIRDGLIVSPAQPIKWLEVAESKGIEVPDVLKQAILTKPAKAELIFAEPAKSLNKSDPKHIIENTFSWQDFHNKNNEKIIENLLDKEAISVGELSALLFPRTERFSCDAVDFDQKIETAPDKILDNFSKVFTELNSNPHKKWKLDLILVNSSVKEITTKETTLVRPYAAISLLVEYKLLPIEICQLSKSKEDGQIFFNNGYHIKDKMLFLESEKIVKNLSIKNWPRTLKYIELQSRLKNIDKNEDEIWQAIFDARMGAYIQVLEDLKGESCVVLNTCDSPFVSNIWSDELEASNSNPCYLKRYNRLERLIIQRESSAISLEQLHTCKSLSLSCIPLNNPRDRYQSDKLLDEHMVQFPKQLLQSTDIETKFNAKRILKSFNGKTEINIADLVFLEEEVNQFLSDFKETYNIINNNKDITETSKDEIKLPDEVIWLISKSAKDRHKWWNELSQDLQNNPSTKRPKKREVAYKIFTICKDLLEKFNDLLEQNGLNPKKLPTVTNIEHIITPSWNSSHNKTSSSKITKDK